MLPCMCQITSILYVHDDGYVCHWSRPEVKPLGSPLLLDTQPYTLHVWNEGWLNMIMIFFCTTVVRGLILVPERKTTINRRKHIRIKQ